MISTTVQINVDTAAIEQEVQKRAREIQSKELVGQIDGFFHIGRKGSFPIAEGVGRQQIREKVEEIIEKLFDENTLIVKLEKRVEHYFNLMLAEAIEDAAKHKARKLTFHALNNILKDKDL